MGYERTKEVESISVTYTMDGGGWITEKIYVSTVTEAKQRLRDYYPGSKIRIITTDKNYVWLRN